MGGENNQIQAPPLPVWVAPYKKQFEEFQQQALQGGQQGVNPIFTSALGAQQATLQNVVLQPGRFHAAISVVPVIPKPTIGVAPKAGRRRILKEGV